MHWYLEKKTTSKSDRLLIVSNKFRTFRVSLMQLPRFNWFSPPPQSWKPASSDPSSHLSQLLSLEGRRLLVLAKIWKSDWNTSMQTENPNIKQSFTTFHVHLYQSLHSREVFLNLLTWFLSRIYANGTLFTANTPSKEKYCKRHVFDDLLLLLISKIKIEKWRMKAFVAWCTKLYAQLKWSYELMIKKEGNIL